MDGYYCILSWNVDGYNQTIHNWLKQLLNDNNPDVIFFNETKLSESELKKYFNEFTNYNTIINCNDPCRYHGIAALIRKDLKYVPYNVDLKIPARQDCKSSDACAGRLIALELEDKMFIVGTYVPNSGVGKLDNHKISKLTYRINYWDPALQSLLNYFQSLKPTIWIGDINVAPHEIDVSNPKTMKNYSGFTPQERQSFNNFMIQGNWIDVWRKQHPKEKSYTWVSYNPRNNYGMRLDNVICSHHFSDKINNAFFLPNCGIETDHLPIGVFVTK